MVDREEAMSLLPFPYATALRLADEGVTEPVIARAVGVEPTALGTSAAAWPTRSSTS